MNILSGDGRAVSCVTDPRSLHLIQRERAIIEGERHREECNDQIRFLKKQSFLTSVWRMDWR